MQGYIDDGNRTYVDFDTHHFGKETPIWGKTSPYKYSKNLNAPFDQEFYLIIN
jgi:hypothetical protein